MADSAIEHAAQYSLFPTLVWESLLRKDLAGTINRLILEQVRELRVGQSPLEAGRSWQSGNRMHRVESLRPLMRAVEQAALAALTLLKVGHQGIEVTGSWINLSAPGAGHAIHAHPNNFLSGVYYAQTAEGADTINFHDPRVQAGVIRPPVQELTGANTDQVVLRVRSGMLLLFPSWLQHSVDANRADIERISVSFNLMFSDYVDSMSSPLW